MPKSKKSYILYGIFGIAILLVAYWGFNFLKGSSIFSKNNTYYVFYDRIEGLNTSSPVTVNGFKVGQVKEIEFLPKQGRQLKITLEITNEFQLPDSTIARITSMDLLGSKGIELIFNDNTNIYHKSGDVLIGQVEQSLKDQVSIQMLPIKNQAENLMKELSNAIEIISYIFNEQTRDNLEKSFASVKTTLTYIEHSAYNLDTLLNSESKKISRIISHVEFLTSSLRNNQQKISNIIANLSTFSDTLAAIDISKVIMEVNMVLEKFNNMVDKIDRGEGSIGQLINDDKFATELENAVNSLDNLLRDLKNNPKKYVSFSLLKIGRTINVTDEEDLSDRDKKRLEKQRRKNEKKYPENSDQSYFDGSLYFMIQIKSTNKLLGKDSPELKNYNNIIERNVDGKFKYFLFAHNNPKQTKYYNEILKDDFPDAFPVAFIGDEMIPYSEGVELFAVMD